MGMKRFLLGAALLGCGCGPGELEQQEELMRRQIQAHFEALNLASAAARQAYLDGPDDPANAAGLAFSSYEYRQDGILVVGVTCPICSLKQDVLPYRSGAGARCVAGCDRDKKLIEPNKKPEELKALFGDKVLSMFEKIEGEEKTLRARVRYVRSQWYFDPEGIIDPPVGGPTAKTLAARLAEDFKAGHFGGVPSLPERGIQGFHRQMATFRGEAIFEYRGGRTRRVETQPEIPLRAWAARDHLIEVRVP
jgi:hypothetical protein